MKNKLIRHGDVNIVPTKLPEGAKLIQETGSFTVAYGEQTGHNHTLATVEPEAKFKVLEHNGQRYFVLNQEAKLTHPEHKTITVLPGVYIQGQEREHDYFAHVTRNVID